MAKKKIELDFKAMLSHCQRYSEISKGLIDNYLLYYAATRFKLDKQFDQEVKKHQFITSKWDPAALRFFKAMYINGRVFGKNGYVTNLLLDKNLRSLRPDEQDFLNFYKEHPWRFSLAVVRKQLADDFFEMMDCFTEEVFLLYSSSVTSIAENNEGGIIYMHRFFNGVCWQSSGMIFAFNALHEDDFYFFATELNSDVASDEMVADELDTNPVPFMMLYGFSRTPELIQAGSVGRICYSMEEEVILNLNQLEQDFRICTFQEYVDLKLLTHEGFPHYARAIYHKPTQVLDLHSWTFEAWVALVTALHQSGVHVEEQPLVVISPVMQIATERILQRKLDFLKLPKMLDEQEDKGKLIELTNHPPAVTQQMDELILEGDGEEAADEEQMMRFLNLAIPYINEGSGIPVEELAQKAGISYGIAKGMADMLQRKFGR